MAQIAHPVALSPRWRAEAEYVLSYSEDHYDALSELAGILSDVFGSDAAEWSEVAAELLEEAGADPNSNPFLRNSDRV